MSLDLAPTPATLDDDALDVIFHEARSVNAFTADDVDPAEIFAAYETLRWGPTAMNTSPLRLAVLPAGEQRDRLLPYLSEGNRPKSAAAPLVVIAAADTRFHDHLAVLAPHRTGLADQLEWAPERRAAMARTSALIQVGYLIVALRARGLQVGPMGGFDAAGLDAELLADRSWSSVLVLNVGWGAAPDGTHPRAARLDAATAVAVL